MKTKYLFPKVLPAMTALMLLGSPSLISLKAQSTASKESEKLDGKSSEATSRPVRFRPPAGNSSASARVTGGSRGVGDHKVSLDVLTPDGIGLTTQEQPSLFWYQSQPADAKFELTLVQDDEPEPLVEMTVERSVKAGIQRLRLADQGVKLVPGVEYKWVVALVAADPDARSGDQISSGMIKRIAATPELKARVAKADPAALAGIYAEAGVWYDALAALTDQIEANPDDKQLEAARTDLLEQVNLKLAEAKQ